MLALLPSIGVGFVGSLLTAIALTADWYIWKVRYRISRGPAAPPPDRKNMIQVPSNSGREVVVHSLPQLLDENVPMVYQTDRESRVGTALGV